jgi:multicomponent Na+:H+ antiporter subunit D
MSKWYLAKGAMEAGRPFFVVVILGGSLLVLLYCFPLIVSAFFAKSETDDGSRVEVDEAPVAILIPLLAMASLCIILGFFPQVLIQMLQ